MILVSTKNIFTNHAKDHLGLIWVTGYCKNLHHNFALQLVALSAILVVH
jgi:hypothetical protein